MQIEYVARRLTALVLTAALLTGCAGSAGFGTGEPTLREGAVPYEIPAFLDSGFHEETARDCGAVLFDASGAAQGYVAVSARSEQKLKLQVSCGEMTYTYNLDSAGEPAVIPLNMGDGSYTFRLMENIGGSKYACSWKEDLQVQQEDEFQCFLRPSQLVNYTEGSACVAEAKRLAENCETDADAAAAIYKYLVRHISYDSEKAATVEPGYLPDPDETLASRKGICFDYASLAAAMMRSLGIPCKLIMGYVDGSLYHAWNTFYTREQGWVTVEIKVSSHFWTRIDTTMAAGGTSANDLLDDSKYTTRYTY